MDLYSRASTDLSCQNVFTAARHSILTVLKMTGICHNRKTANITDGTNNENIPVNWICKTSQSQHTKVCRTAN